MKKLLFACVFAAVLLCSGCDKEVPGKQVIENNSGYEWHNTQILLSTPGGGRDQEDVGVVGEGKKVTINTTHTQFKITAKDAHGNRLMSKTLSFSSGTTSVVKSDFGR